MTDWTLQLYHRLPARARTVVARLKGLQLRSWRYGAETDSLVAEALWRDRWSEQQWKWWQEEQLARILHRAAKQVPYYREQWAARRRRGDHASWEYLENWPVLEKEPVRVNPNAFLSDRCDRRRLFREHTSGTTGKSLDLWWSLKTVRGWYALFEARARAWYGVSRHDRWAILGGQLVVPSYQRRPPFWVWNASLNQLYMSSYHLAPDLIRYYLDALAKHRVKYLCGYTSSLYELALGALEVGRSNIRMKVAITNAEPVYDYQRKAIEKAFSCPLRETYGMAEIVAAASECERGRLHLWPEVGVVEILEGNQSAPNGDSGDLVCTGLINEDMPLIRYRTGDRGALRSSGAPCDCGRSLPVLSSVEGRTDSVLYTTDGRRIGRLDPVFKEELPIREAQIIQESLTRIRVRYAPSSEYTASAGSSIIDRLRARMGNVEVILEPVAEVPRGANGKYQAVVCGLSAQELEQIQSVHK